MLKKRPLDSTEYGATNALQELEARGYIQQCTHPGELRRCFETDRVTFYAGFDPTANSLHVGSLVPIMAMAHLQRMGHIPIVIIGGGTAMIGDPSGKSEARRMMSREEIQENGKTIAKQIGRILTLDGQRGFVLDNADWLLDIRYIEFLRDIGVHFRVNEMLRTEGYRQRLEREEGLSFIEFNYQLLQSYDFLVLLERFGCSLQMGGDDQWGNILAGVDLIHRLKGRVTKTAGKKQQARVFGLTFPLLETASGQKMGKTERGAIWLDAEKTSPYELYQYWINMSDTDVGRFLRLFTFLSLEEIKKLEGESGSSLGRETLAYESTKIVHGKDYANQAREASRCAFGGSIDEAELPSIQVSRKQFAEEITTTDLFVVSKLATSRSNAKRLIGQGGAYINEIRIDNPDQKISPAMLRNGSVVLRRGKKQYCRVAII